MTHRINPSPALSFVTGHSGRLFYRARLKASRNRFERLFVDGTPKYANEMPEAWLEYDGDENTTPLAIGGFFPEGFLRTCSTLPGKIRLYIAFLERLLDFEAVLINREPYLTSFLSSTRYYFQVSTGIVMPLTIPESFLAHRDNSLVDEFERPTPNTATLDCYVKKMPTLSAGLNRIADIMQIYKLDIVEFP